MDPRLYLAALRRRWPLIVVLAILGVGAAYLYDSTLPTLYKSTASVFVSARSGQTTSELVQGSTFAQANVQSYAQLARTPKVLQPVIDELDLATTPQGLAKAVTADAPLNTVIIEITVVNGDPVRAAKIADAVTASLSDAVEEISPSSEDEEPAIKMTQVAPAQVPAVPFAPNTRFILATGLILGLALGAVIALIWELLDTRIRSEKDLARIAELPLLGSVARRKRNTPGWIALQADAHSIQAESYRRIRTNLEFADIDRPVHSVIVTSASAGEGKSTTSINLALAMAERMGRVLLIDADLRRPTIAERCGLEGGVGLTTVLLGKVTVEEAVQRYDDSVDVLTSGLVPHNPGQLLGSAAMAALLKQATRSYDFVVIDTPPLLAATDTLGLAHATDGAILVVRFKSTRRQQLGEALDSMRAVNARMLGIVLDRVDLPKTDQYYSYRPQTVEPDAAPQGPHAKASVRPEATPTSPAAKKALASQRAASRDSAERTDDAHPADDVTDAAQTALPELVGDDQVVRAPAVTASQETTPSPRTYPQGKKGKRPQRPATPRATPGAASPGSAED